MAQKRDRAQRMLDQEVIHHKRTWKNKTEYEHKAQKRREKSGTTHFFALLLICRKTKYAKRSCSMYILTQGSPLENSKNGTYHVQSAALEKEYSEAGYECRERVYKITYKHRDYAVHCMEFRNDNDGREAVMLIPDFLIPGRRYPVEVYLYAIDIYSSNPAKGQRWAAEGTRKRFGLETFAHTTLGRALKTLVGSLTRVCECADSEGTGNMPLPSGIGRSSTEPNCHGIPAVHATRALRERASRFLRGHVPGLDVRTGISSYRRISREWYCVNRRLLL